MVGQILKCSFFDGGVLFLTTVLAVYKYIKNRIEDEQKKYQKQNPL